MIKHPCQADLLPRIGRSIRSNPAVHVSEKRPIFFDNASRFRANIKSSVNGMLLRLEVSSLKQFNNYLFTYSEASSGGTFIIVEEA